MILEFRNYKKKKVRTSKEHQLRYNQKFQVSKLSSRGMPVWRTNKGIFFQIHHKTGEKVHKLLGFFFPSFWW